jgi:hypothetical protein
MLKKNINTPGRLLRLLIAILLLVYAVWQDSWVALIFSLFTFFEVLMSWCIIYQLFGINHCPIDKDK